MVDFTALPKFGEPFWWVLVLMSEAVLEIWFVLEYFFVFITWARFLGAISLTSFLE